MRWGQYVAELCLDQRRRNVFRYTGVDTAAQFAVAHAVEKINQQTNSEPDKETDPGEHRQAEHEHETQKHADDRKQRHEWDTKRPRTPSVGPPQNGHADANENECEQSSDVRQI